MTIKPNPANGYEINIVMTNKTLIIRKVSDELKKQPYDINFVFGGSLFMADIVDIVVRLVVMSVVVVMVVKSSVIKVRSIISGSMEKYGSIVVMVWLVMVTCFKESNDVDNEDDKNNNNNSDNISL